MVSGLDRKSCWTIAEHRGAATPDAVRDDLRDYVIDAFGDRGAMLVVNATGDIKKGVHSVRVQRRYSGTAGRIENSQVAVHLTYAAPRRHALIDRALYLPKSWTEDAVRRAGAGIPEDKQGFATKPTLAVTLIDRVVAAKVPAGWGAGDEVYGADPLRRRRSPQTEDLVLGLVSSAARRRHRHRRPSFADPPQRRYRRARLPALLQPPPGAVAHPGGSGRKALAHRRILRGRQRPHRHRLASGTALDVLAPLDQPWPCSPTPSWP